MQFLEREKKLFLKEKETKIKYLNTLFEKVGFLFLDKKEGFTIVPINKSRFALQSNKGLLVFCLLTFLLSLGFVLLNSSKLYYLLSFLVFIFLGSITVWRIKKLLAFEINLDEDCFSFKNGKQTIELKRKVIVETYVDEVDTDTVTRSTRCWDFNAEDNVLSKNKLVNVFTLSEVGNGERFLVRDFCFYLMVCKDIEVEFVERK